MPLKLASRRKKSPKIGVGKTEENVCGMLIYFYDYVRLILRFRDGVNEVHKYIYCHENGVRL